jgi:hypothetical protein
MPIFAFLRDNARAHIVAEVNQSVENIGADAFTQ